jgi:ABC-type glycerol-3-phosphate transport system substrate-binding protein
MTLWTHDDGLVSFLGNRFKEWIPSKPGWDIKTDFQVVADPPTKELTALAAAQGVPDFFGVQSDNFSKFQKGDICVNAFVPVDALIKEAGGPDAFVKLSIYSWKGKMYAADWAAGPLLYFYREDLFQAAGVKLPIETFDDLVNEGQKLKAKGQFMEQFNASGPWLAKFDHYLEARNSQGVFDKDGNVLLDSQEAIDTLQMLSDLAHKQKVLDVYDTANAEVVGYQRNQVAGTVHADWWAHYIMAAEVKEQVGKWRAMVMPQQVKGVATAPLWGGIGTTIYQKSPVRDLLLDLYNFAFCKTENAVKVWTEIGFLPTMRSTWTRPEVLNFAYPTLGGQTWGQVAVQAATNLVAPYYGPFWNEHFPITGKAVYAVMMENAKPDEALKAAAKELRDLIAKG